MKIILSILFFASIAHVRSLWGRCASLCRWSPGGGESQRGLRGRDRFLSKRFQLSQKFRSDFRLSIKPQAVDSTIWVRADADLVHRAGFPKFKHLLIACKWLHKSFIS